MSKLKCAAILASLLLWTNVGFAVKKTRINVEEEKGQTRKLSTGGRLNVDNECLAFFISMSNSLYSQLPKLRLFSENPKLSQFIHVADAAWRQSLLTVRGFVQRELLDFQNPEFPFHANFTSETDDLNRIRQHAAAAILGHKDTSGAGASVKMVYFLHLLDDIVDSTALLDYPEPLLKKLQNPRGFRKVYFSQNQDPAVISIRDASKNLMSVIKLMKRTIRQRFGAPTPDDMRERLRAVEDSAFVIFLASAASRHYGDDRDAYEWSYHLNILKMQSLYMLKSKELRQRFFDFPPSLFYLVAKTPMYAMMALESSEYSTDNAFVWSVLFAPFFYNFQKPRQAHQVIDTTSVVVALHAARASMNLSSDPYLGERINQLKYMFKVWPNFMPPKISEFYQNLISDFGEAHVK